MIRTAIHTIGFLITIISIVLARPTVVSAQSYTCDIDHPDSLTCTFGATCNGCGVMPPYYSGGAANDWDCQWSPQCIVSTPYDPLRNTVTCSTYYQFSEQCIASDVCCNDNGTGPEVCWQSCGASGCSKGYQSKTCCQADGSYGTCDAIPLTRTCTVGVTTVGTSCSGTAPTNTPGPTPTPGGPTNTPAPAPCAYSCVLSGSCPDPQKRGGVCGAGTECCQLGTSCSSMGGSCRKSNPFQGGCDDGFCGPWSGAVGYSNVAQCSSTYLPNHWQRTGTLDPYDANCSEINGCDPGEFNCNDICCGNPWPTPTPIATATPTATPTPTCAPPPAPGNPSLSCDNSGTDGIFYYYTVNQSWSAVTPLACADTVSNPYTSSVDVNANFNSAQLSTANVAASPHAAGAFTAAQTMYGKVVYRDSLAGQERVSAESLSSSLLLNWANCEGCPSCLTPSLAAEETGVDPKAYNINLI